MTDAPTPAPDFAPYVPGEENGSRWSGAAIAALVLAIGVTVALLSLKTLGAAWAFPPQGTDYAIPAAGLGLVLGLGIGPDILTVVFGHIALAQTANGARRGRVIAAIALGAGYVHILLWGNRLINAAVAAAGVGSFAEFVPDLFWWA
jgi:hypothetical protein